MDPNVSLQLLKRADETIWGKAISSIGRVVYSSNFNIYILLNATKRNSVVKAFHNYININSFKEESKREAISEKYKKAYSNYINSLEKSITENIYSKVRKGAASLDEQHILSKYYEVCKYKNEDQVLYRTKLEKVALNMDWNTVQSAKSDNYISRYKEFYLYNIEELYKAEMRHDAILLANAKQGDRDQYEAVYNLIETYIKEVLPILPENRDTSAIIKDYRKYVSALDAYEKKDFLELRKRLALLGFSRALFEYSLPMLAKEQCYKEILEIARVILTNYYTEAEQFAAYEVILDGIEEYVDNILDYKTTWDSEQDKKDYEQFNEKFAILKKLARIDYDGYKRQREVLFIKYDLKYLNKNNIKLPELRAYYRERLIIRNALRRLKNHSGTIAGSWKSNKKLVADPITTKEEPAQEVAEYFSPIDRLVEDISKIVKAQVEEYEARNVSTVDNAVTTEENSEETVSTANSISKTIINFTNYFLNGNKKYKKRKAL